MELSRSPVITLDKYLDKKILVCLKNDFKLQGVLKKYDKFNNMILYDTV